LIQWLGGNNKNNSYVIVRTLRRGIPRVMVFMVGVLPIFIGYALFGTTTYCSVHPNFDPVILA
jgi:hypothetical protein